jgi:hypothetical protein
MTIIVREVNGQTVVSNDVGTAIADALLPQVALAQAAETAAEAARDALLAGAPRTETGTAYTLQVSDNRYYILFSAATAITVTVPSGLAADADYFVEMRNTGLGQITVSAGAGATVRNKNNFFTTDTSGTLVSLIARAVDDYDLDGTLA